LTDKDVLISPALGDISAGSFERASDAIRIGEEAARAAADRLRRYSLPPVEYAELRSRQTGERRAVTAVDEIRFEGLQRTNPEVLRSLVQTRPGEPLSEETIGADLRRIYGRGDFESVDYRIVQEPGKRVMIIQPREKSWGPDYLRFGLGLATDFSWRSAVHRAGAIPQDLVEPAGRRMAHEAQIGRENRLFTEFYQPVDERGRWFVAPYASVGRSTRGVFVGEDRVAEYDVKEVASAWTAGAVSAPGASCGWAAVARVDASVDTGSLVSHAQRDSAGVKGAPLRGSARQPVLSPRRLSHGRVGYVADGSLGSDRNYKRFEGDVRAAKSWGAHTFNVNLSGAPIAFQYAGLRDLYPGRSAAPVGLSHKRVLRPANAFRQGDVLQPRAASARRSWDPAST
jgi:NTE family protein